MSYRNVVPFVCTMIKFTKHTLTPPNTQLNEYKYKHCYFPCLPFVLSLFVLILLSFPHALLTISKRHRCVLFDRWKISIQKNCREMQTLGVGENKQIDTSITKTRFQYSRCNEKTKWKWNIESDRKSKLSCALKRQHKKHTITTWKIQSV